MTTPLGASPPVHSPAPTRPIGAPAAAPLAPTDTVAAQTRWSSPPQARPTADHLALVLALIKAGQLTRALELLDAVWHHDLHDERTWYLRLWVVAAQGRILEALELSRCAAAQLPGSAAIACLQASLEYGAGDPDAALEAALRAAAIAPGRPEAESTLDLLLSVREPHRDPLPITLKGEQTPPPPLNPVAMAISGLALLHPPGSPLVFRPPLTAIEPPALGPSEDRPARRRLWLMVLATVVAAVWAVREPLLASTALAGVLAWLSRRGRPSRS